jgi:predicted DNA-binding protein
MRSHSESGTPTCRYPQPLRNSTARLTPEQRHRIRALMARLGKGKAIAALGTSLTTIERAEDVGIRPKELARILDALEAAS